MRLENCRVYRVAYVVLDEKRSIVSQVANICVIAIDVADVVDQIKKSCVGIEITDRDQNDNLIHAIAEDVEIISTELVGRLHGITDKAYSIITDCNRREQSHDV